MSFLNSEVAHLVPLYTQNRKVVLGGRCEDAICEIGVMVNAPIIGMGFNTPLIVGSNPTSRSNALKRVMSALRSYQGLLILVALSLLKKRTIYRESQLVKHR